MIISIPMLTKLGLHGTYLKGFERCSSNLLEGATWLVFQAPSCYSARGVRGMKERLWWHHELMWIFQQRASLSGLCLEQMSNGWPFSLMTSKWAKWGLIIKLGNPLRFLKTVQKIVQSDMPMLDGTIRLTSWGLWLISSQQEWNAITLISSDGWLAKNEKNEINRSGWMNISNAWKPRNMAMPS